MVSSKLTIKSVVVHPLVLLSTVDHFTRLSTNSNQRVIGVLLGSVNDGVVDVTNSYAGNNQKKYLWLIFTNLLKKFLLKNK